MALRNLPAKVKRIPPFKVFDVSSKRTECDATHYEPKDVETHTGQKWESNDSRMNRFVDKEKLVNPNWGIKLIAEVPPIPVNGRIACCDGGSGPTGHPKIYINLDKPGVHSCLYCGLRFYKDESCH